MVQRLAYTLRHTYGIVIQTLPPSISRQLTIAG